MVLNEEEILEALRNGAVLNISESGEVKIQTLDDLSPEVRECYRASRAHDMAHRRQCPDCLESEAENTLMDAASHREDGNEAIALELEVEAAETRLHAATLRKSRFLEAENAEPPRRVTWRRLLNRAIAPFRSLTRFIV
jgi:hypothetical protein